MVDFKRETSGVGSRRGGGKVSPQSRESRSGLAVRSREYD